MLERPVRSLVALYAAVVPLGALSLPIGLGAPFDSLSSVLGGLAIVVLAAHLVLARGRAVRVVPEAPVWLLLVGVAALTATWSLDAAASWTATAVLASLAALYALTGAAAVERRDFAWLEGGIVAGGALAGLWGLWLLAADEMTRTDAGEPRFGLIGAEGGDPNITAAALLLPLLIAVGWGLEGPGWRRRVGLAAAVLAAVGVVLTGSRGGLLGALVGLGVLIAASGARRGLPALFGAFAVAATAAVALAPDTSLDRLAALGSTGRLHIWRIGLEACEQVCWWGTGPGTFPIVHAERSLAHPEAFGPFGGYEAHNLWLSVAVEHGLAGLVLLCVALALTAATAAGLPDPLRGRALAGIAALVVTSIFLSSLGFKYFWLVPLYVAVARNATGGRSAPSPPTPQRSLQRKAE